MAMNLNSNYAQSNEQDLVQDLIEEVIEQRGFDVHYIVREQINPDDLLGEASISDFKEFHIMPMFLESMEHFNGSGDLYDEFGMSFNDAAILQVGARRFRQTLNDKIIVRPREGDLVYIPFSDSLWIVNKVKKDLQYYQLGKNYSYRLICKVFEYSHEKIETATKSNFNIGEANPLDDEGLMQELGLKQNDQRDNTPEFKAEEEKFKTFDPSDPFGF